MPPQPLPDLEEAAAKLEERSLYAAPFPFDTGLDQLQAFFSEQGAVRSVRLRRHLGTADFKGSIFVEFQTAELAAEVRRPGLLRRRGGTSALRSARLPANLIGSPINYANRLIGSPIKYANRLIGSPVTRPLPPNRSPLS